MKTIFSLTLLVLMGFLLAGCGLLELAGVSVIRASDVDRFWKPKT